jgi:hypothetical protein
VGVGGGRAGDWECCGGREEAEKEKEEKNCEWTKTGRLRCWVDGR